MAKILILDEVPDLLDLLSTVLKHGRHEATMARGGQAAAELLRHHTYDVMITKLRMKPISGFDLLRIAHKDQPRMPTIVLDADRTVEAVVEAMKGGAYDYLAKPFRLADLIRSVERALQYKAARRAAMPISSKPRVFLSHSHADKGLVRGLSRTLRNHGIWVWVDEAELKPGDSLIDKLRSAIEAVDVLIAVLSPASVKSRWVQKEIEIAMTQEINGRRIRVIPVMICHCELPGFLLGKVYSDFTTPHRRKMNRPKLIESIRSASELKIDVQ